MKTTIKIEGKKLNVTEFLAVLKAVAEDFKLKVIIKD
jgi:hypothetical protein|tara:strand:+ start:1132 stop:1242 length:111 start_codon:yes stop_codon:yes gene_type:complete